MELLPTPVQLHQRIPYIYIYIYIYKEMVDFSKSDKTTKISG